MNKPSITNLIRQYCDGELNDEQTAQVEQHLQDHPEDQSIVDSERKLRKRIEAVIKADCPHAPVGLADQIKAELAKDDVSSDSEVEPYKYSLKSWIAGPSKANMFAVAASLALVVGAVLFGIFGRPIDSPSTGVSQAAEAAESVGLEHIKAATDTSWPDMDAMECYSCETAQKAYCRQLGTDRIPRIDLSLAGYEFKGGMVCEVPYCDTSYHLFYRQQNGQGLVSIHIVRDTGKLNLDDGEPFGSKMPLKTARFYLDEEIMGKKPCVVVFSDGEIMYLVMACETNDTEQVIDSIQAAIVNQGH